MCEFCAENDAVLPSIEAFQKGLDIPVVYMIFYDYFFKASVGEAKWTSRCEDHKDNALLGSAINEVFAMMMLKNNYFAWLLEAMKALPALVTEYCPEQRRRKKLSVGQVWMENLEIDIRGGSADKTYLVNKDDRRYGDLTKITGEQIKIAVRQAKENGMFPLMIKTLKEIGDKPFDFVDMDEAQGLSVMKLKRLGQSKRRAILKPFKVYTTRQKDERPFQGWSPTRAPADMASLSRKIKCADYQTYREKFKEVYKEVYALRNVDNRRRKKVLSGLEEENCKVDYRDVWDLMGSEDEEDDVVDEYMAETEDDEVGDVSDEDDGEDDDEESGKNSKNDESDSGVRMVGV